LGFLEDEEISEDISRSALFEKPQQDELKNLNILTKVSYLSGESFYEGKSQALLAGNTMIFSQFFAIVAAH